MSPALSLRFVGCFLTLCGCLATVALAQTLSINNDIQTYATLPATTATLTGRSELRITSATNPIAGSIINLNSADAWFFMTAIRPSVVNSTYLVQLRVNGAAAVSNTNCRIVQYGDGTVVIPQSPTYPAMQVFAGRYFTGAATSLTSYTAYNDASLGTFANNIASFKLKRGYTATIAQNVSGTGVSKNYVAQDGDIEVSVLPDELTNSVSFIRIFPWRWTNKKGIAGNIYQNLNVRWYYNWNLDQNSSLDHEYVPIRAQRYWPDLTQNWQTRGANHLLGYNEPNSVDQSNILVGDAIWSWPDLLGTGLRVGSPAPTDGGLGWLYSFIDQADTAALRVDFVAVHYYRSYFSASDPVGATAQFYSFLKGIYDQVKRPLWVTEWNNGANWTTGPDPTAAQQEATVSKMIEMLDNTPFVERYSLYNWVEDVRRLQWDDGSLTAAGVTYRDKVSPLAYTQVIPEVPTPAAAWYRFENDARDSTPNGHAAMLKGSAKYMPGHTGQAVALSGGNGDFVQLPSRLGDGTDFTFGAWIFWTGSSQWQRIFDLGNGTGEYLYLTPRSGTNTTRFEIYQTGTNAQRLETAQLTPNTWVHVAVTITGSTGKLFVNGALTATNPGMTLNPGDLSRATSYLGKSQFSADPLFAGRLDDVQFLPYALADTKVAAMMTNSPPVFSAASMSGGTATQGTAYTGSIAGTAADSDAVDTVSYSKADGPDWLIVSASGALSGTPTQNDQGAEEFIVFATDTAGVSAFALLTITLSNVLGPGTWAVNADGNWGGVANWSGNFPANGIGNTANFNTLNITADRTVTLDTSRSIGTLLFGDTSGTQAWTLAAASGKVLTLEMGSGQPTIAVNQTTATISATLAGASGLVKSGTGTLVLRGDNDLAGTLDIDTGSNTANEGAVRLAHPNAASAVAAIEIRTNNSGRSTLELDGTLGPVLVSAPLSLTGRGATTPAIRNIIGTNTLSGGMTIGVGGANYIIQSDAGMLTLGGTITSVATGARTYTFQGGGNTAVTANIADGSAIAAVTKTGSGALTLGNANNSFDGPLIVNGGTVVAGQSAAFNFGNAPTKGPLGNPQVALREISVNAGATLILAAANIFGSGASTTAPLVTLTINAGGLVEIAAPVAVSPGPGGGDTNIFGNLVLNGGTFTTGNGYSSAYQAAILMGNVTATGSTASSITTNAANAVANGIMLGKTGGGTVTFDVSTTGGGGLTVSVPLTNSANGGIGALTKTGTGTLTLTSANTYTGTTTISAGKLVLSGVLASPVSAAGGTFSAKGSPTTSSNITISSSGRFEATITGAGNDSLAVGGSITLGGALDLVASAGLPNGATFTLFNKTGPGAASGIFAGKPAGTLFSASGYQWLLNYAGGDGNDIVLSIATALQLWRQQYFGSVATSGNAADTFDANGDGEPNLLEFATGQSPNAATTSLPTVVQNGAMLEFTYTRSLAAVMDGLTFTPAWSDTLAAESWSNAGVAEQVVAANGTVQIVKASVPAGDGPTRFLHLRVTK